MKFGNEVTVSAVFKRRTKGQNMPDTVYKYWEKVRIKTRSGLFLGIRTISNGARDYDPDYGCVYRAKEYIKAALVVFSEREKPVYAPMENVEEIKA